MLKLKTLTCLSLLLLSYSVVPLAQSAAKPAGPNFSSVYTDLDKECKNAFKDVGEGQDMPLRCKGYGGYQVHISYSAWATQVTLETRNENDSIPLVTEMLIYPKGKKIEWRMADGKPYAVIMRISKYRENDSGDNPYQEKYKTGDALVVKGLKGYERISFEVDAKLPNANARARELADQAYLERRAD